MNNCKSIIPILFIFITVGVASAQSSFHFLTLNSSARAAALGGAFVSMPEDATAIFINPATLSTMQDSRLSATFLKHVVDINSGLISYNANSELLGKYAVSAQFTSNGSFQGADKNGIKTTTFSGTEIALSGTITNMFDSNFYYGATVKLIYSGLEKTSSTALAADVGLLYQIPKSRVNIGFSILNLGAQLSKYGTESESLPVDARLGINHRLRGLPLLLNFSFHHLADETDGFFDRFANFSIGGELTISKVIDLRLGYDNLVRKSVSLETQRGFSGFGAGVGVKTKNILVDYGVSSLGSPATLHRLSVNLKL
ncbi:MAG: type IX secretion system protein PorQ [Ignavibacteria bacterium]|nr:type IX secretion system protein PorQ [Ignavibacteria bacterium]